MTVDRCSNTSMTKMGRIDRGELGGDGLNRLADLGLSMAGSNEEPEPRRAFFHCRVHDRLNVDPLLEQPVGESQGEQRIAGDDRDHRSAAAFAGIEPERFRFPQKLLAPLPQGADPFGLFAELTEGGVHFRLWAPAHTRVTLVLEPRMTATILGIVGTTAALAWLVVLRHTFDLSGSYALEPLGAIDSGMAVSGFFASAIQFALAALGLVPFVLLPKGRWQAVAAVSAATTLVGLLAKEAALAMPPLCSAT